MPISSLTSKIDLGEQLSPPGFIRFEDSQYFRSMSKKRHLTSTRETHLTIAFQVYNLDTPVQVGNKLLNKYVYHSNLWRLVPASQRRKILAFTVITELTSNSGNTYHKVHEYKNICVQMYMERERGGLQASPWSKSSIKQWEKWSQTQVEFGMTHIFTFPQVKKWWCRRASCECKKKLQISKVHFSFHSNIWKYFHKKPNNWNCIVHLGCEVQND